MITGIEIPFALAFIYPSLNYIWLFPRLKPNVEKEVEHEPQEMDGVELYDYRTEVHPPTYINVNNIMVPVAGYTSKEKKLLLTKHISTNTKKEYFNFHQIDNETDRTTSYTNKGHINTYSALENTFKYYNIPTDRFAINLPLEIQYYKYKQGFYLHRVGLVASNKELLVKEVLWRKRLPLTMTIPIIATVSLVCCWGWYGLDGLSSYGRYYFRYYPPFHYKRIKNYFK